MDSEPCYPKQHQHFSAGRTGYKISPENEIRISKTKQNTFLFILESKGSGEESWDTQKLGIITESHFGLKGGMDIIN